MNPENPEADLHQPGSEQRRSWRFPIIVVLQVKWEQDKVIFSEDAEALEANLHGAVLQMKTHPPVGTKIELTNRLSSQTVQAQVVALRHSKFDGVAVELHMPSETFWGTTFRLKKAAADLRTIEREIKNGGADPRVLREFRDAVDFVRKSAWAVYEYQERQVRRKDASTVLSLLTVERVRRGTQLNNDIAANFDSRELTSETPGIAELLRAVERVAERLRMVQPNTGNRSDDVPFVGSEIIVQSSRA
jgi:hypothetical protein